ncbi:MAG: cell division protein ZapE, partial [Gammaproteobacteria bacterium]|nr:cell division protein ZapE [Gammaproteobacteria bacterium]
MSTDTTSSKRSDEPGPKSSGLQPPKARYEAAVQAGELTHDPAQASFVARLDDLRTRLLTAPPSTPQKSRISRWFGRAEPQTPDPVRGIYVWGGVGRGKTLMMDMFFQSIPFAEKRRNHFHDFMTHTHQALKSLSNQQDPLAIVAGRYASQFRLLCFDEFHVSDIADAMILG